MAGRIICYGCFKEVTGRDPAKAENKIFTPTVGNDPRVKNKYVQCSNCGKTDGLFMEIRNRGNTTPRKKR